MYNEFMYNVGSQRPGSSRDQRVFDQKNADTCRRNLGKKIQTWIVSDLDYDQDDYVDELRGFAKDNEPLLKMVCQELLETAESEDTLAIAKIVTQLKFKPCNLDKTTLSKVIQGDPKRNLGDASEPYNLFWMTVFFMYKGLISMTNQWHLHSWLYQDCGKQLVNHNSEPWLVDDNGRAWIEYIAPRVVRGIISASGRQPITDPGVRILDQTSEPETQPIPNFRENAGRSFNDESFIQWQRRCLEQYVQDKGLLKPVVSNELISMILGYTSRE